ncbi:transcriptional repressor [Acidovorax sp. sif1233]|jgi:Fur family ferric uptake transcriptional regulator|uniref:Fur family transcriptional regulator n=1 Tax=unclassified Acidovorax TaxID=2684926 RepID=UPI001C46102E|nr:MULTISPECIES: transcriptional repressor [unclassified Acidovorax]MBV7430780.1 transcriptional repressor [Acidovorax sp. sif0732]MBV7451886.1 transcriptional repressor [Acidovorax sp. sif0715]MBV7457228.1 transcriptional repressor [Acidovorax sp. sif1233]
MERATRQRAAIHAAIATAGRPLSPQEVLEAARADIPSLGVATVYRNLRALMEDGTIEPVTLPGSSARYEMAGQDHHHHFLCRVCHRVFDIHACPGGFAHLAPPGFTVDGHDITLYGQCSDCQPPPPAKKAPAPARRGLTRG